MGTITTFTKKDGSISYTARVRISRAGKQIHNEVETFSRKALAQAWIKRRETELAAPGVLEHIHLPDPPLGDIITRYLDETLTRSGRTKRFTLKAIAKSELGKMPASAITSQRITEYAKDRVTAGANPATVANDLTLLGTVFDLAAPAWGYRLKRDTLNDAKIVCYKLGYIGRASERTRRPTTEELDALMHHFHDAARRRPWSAPMVKMLPFAIFSTRRLEEMLRRYTHMNGKGDRLAGWRWLDVAIAWQPKKNPSAP